MILNSIINIYFFYLQIDGHDSGTESDGEINQTDELRDHDMELSKYILQF